MPNRQETGANRAYVGGGCRAAWYGLVSFVRQCKKIIMKRGKDMARPVNKPELLQAAAEKFEELNNFITSMTERELSTTFDFSGIPSKKERHWSRDKNLRDVLIHLNEWHNLVLNWVAANEKGENKPLLPAPYNWRTYGDMNMEFWEKHQNTTLEEAKKALGESHNKMMALIERFSQEELFSRGVFPWCGDNALGSYFVSNMSSHYEWALKKLKSHRKILREGNRE